MDEAAALRIAFQLVHIPSQIRRARAAPLPEGLLLLLQIAAGDEEALARAALMGRQGAAVKDAAAFFIEQILLAPGADSYRVLGGDSNSDNKDLRRNMTLLLKWLHPDVQRLGERSVFARRVSLAWDDLKTPERRAAYDRERRENRARHFHGLKSRALEKPLGKGAQPIQRPPQIRAVKPSRQKEYRRFFQQALRFLFGGNKF